MIPCISEFCLVDSFLKGNLAMAMASYVAGSPVPLPLPPGPPVRLDLDARAESHGLARPPFFGTTPVRMWNWPLAPLLRRAGNQVVRKMPSNTRL